MDIATDAEGDCSLSISPDVHVVMIRTLHRDPTGDPARLLLTGGPPIKDLTLAQGVQGDPDTIYFLGSFNLQEGEWLEITMPGAIPGYWSLHAYNYWCESLPGASIGDNSCIAEADGSIRIAVGQTGGCDAPNRIDTLSRRRGALIFRFIGAINIVGPTTVVRAGTSSGES